MMIFRNGIPFYRQTDYPDVPYNRTAGNRGLPFDAASLEPEGTVSSDGCGITCFSMILSARTGEAYSPREIAPWAMENGANTVLYWDSFQLLAEHYGIPFGGQYVGPCWGGGREQMLARLKAGNLIIASMLKKTFFAPVCGHYIVLCGLSEDGKILVNDPGRHEHTGAYDAELVMGTCKQYWVFP